MLLTSFDLKEYHITVKEVLRNASPSLLYEKALLTEKGTVLSDKGALMVCSHEKTGRSPKDKRIVEHPDSRENVWWGKVNQPINEVDFLESKKQAMEYMNGQEVLYVVDGFAGWDVKTRIKIRVICTRPYHALFMHNMLIRPTAQELDAFGTPEYTILNAGCSPVKRHFGSTTAIHLSFEHREMILLGTEYAGEMKKGVFTIMNYLMPKKGVLSMHCSANASQEEPHEEVSLFFGLSGTGKTTLSADPKRRLIGDDEHGWSEEGVFNIEGGCYAKVIGLCATKEPQIYKAIRYGTILENVDYHALTRNVLYNSSRLTQNTRASYPIEYIPNCKLPCKGGHPTNIIFLTCDAFGVLPPVSELTPNQACYHFISGYTAKVAGTEMGVSEPEATFSACFGEAFLIWHPNKYATLLREKMLTHKTHVWLVNTGWYGGTYKETDRIPLEATRAILDAIHQKKLIDVPQTYDSIFGFKIPLKCPGIPNELLNPQQAWKHPHQYRSAAQALAERFQDNFKKYAHLTDKDILEAGPRLQSSQDDSNFSEQNQEIVS